MEGRLVHWNVNPELISLGFLHVRWYGLFFLLGFSGGYQVMHWMFLREKKSVESLPDLLTAMILGTVIGARLGHCFFYEPGYFLSNPLEIVKVWNGGLASHGGALGVLCVMWRFSRKHPEMSFTWLLDRMMLPIALTAGCIRFGNLMNSEIIGHPTTVPWAFIFDRIDQVPRHPAQLYEGFSYLLVFGVLFSIYRKLKVPPPRLLLGVGFIGLFGARFIWEFFKEDQAAFEAGMILNMGQLLSIPFFIFGVFILVKSVRDRPRTSTAHV